MRYMSYISMHKNAALPKNIQIPLDATETQIFNFIRAACDDIGTILGQRPTARAAGIMKRMKNT